MSDFLIIHTLEFWQIGVIILTGFFASFIGNAAGSDGFIYMIGLNYINIPIIKSIGSMKWFSFINAFYSILEYKKRKSFVAYKFLKFLLPFGLPIWIMASCIGAFLAQYLSDKILYYILPCLTLIMAIYKTIFLNPNAFCKRRISNNAFFYGILTIMFFYIGFFGPGGATFIIFLASLLIGMPLKEGSIIARHVSFTANIASVIIFTYQGKFYIDIILITTISGIFGTMLSTKFIYKYGSNFINIALILILYFVSIVYFHKIFFKIHC